MTGPHAPAALLKLAADWIAAWNSRDLDQVLALYTDDTEMSSEKIVALGFDASGTLRGKDELRAYWSKALTFRPHLHFTLVDAFASPDSVIVHYHDEAGKQVCEYLRLDDAGKIRQASGNYPVG
ncbi:nuclear transport factor 2 family protein [Bradyrhizobium sp.]|uniref:nuclear transport factor 2 family protein n=1 Tax=Bradyrhizobium sp. TaxID=376 RepID=UPI002397BBEF|nr:nuclear transport factor 2 family protein [Bradyrhizobium sp.]MDE1935139.1 nuclear transport factor 2 family protein [Bradyrhizobium sp.]